MWNRPVEEDLQLVGRLKPPETEEEELVAKGTGKSISYELMSFHFQ